MKYKKNFHRIVRLGGKITPPPPYGIGLKCLFDHLMIGRAAEKMGNFAPTTSVIQSISRKGTGILL